jgi:hypothetical protein
MAGKVDLLGFRAQELIDRRVGKAESRTLARLVARAERDDPVEGARERGGIVFQAQEDARRTWDGRR